MTMPVCWFTDRVKHVEERYREVYHHGHGEEAVFVKQSLGWFVVLSDNHLAVFAGYNKPEIDPGNMVKITVEKL